MPTKTKTNTNTLPRPDAPPASASRAAPQAQPGPAVKRAAAPPVERRETPFSRLTTLAVERLANALSKHGELTYQRLFGLHLSECRVLGIALTHEPTSLSEVCEQLELDKGHVSRLVTKLVAAGLLERHAAVADQRSAHLVLTAAGRDTALRVRAAAAARDRAWMGALSNDEATAFMAAVTRMTKQARAMLAEEARHQTGAQAPTLRSARETGLAVDVGRVRPLVVERQVLEDLRRRLDSLLDGDGGAADAK